MAVKFLAMLMSSGLLYLSSCRGSSKQVIRKPSLYPVVLVPGYMCSQLLYSVQHGPCPIICSQDSNCSLWLSIANHDPENVDSWIENARMRYNRSSHRTQSRQGVTVTPRDIGKTDGIDFFSPDHDPDSVYFDKLIHALQDIGYERDVNLLGAPYDWRMAYHENEEFQSGLKSQIESNFHQNGDRPVILVCHSMGCTFVYSFLLQQSSAWKEKYVKSWIMIAAPFGGMFRYMYGYLADDDYPQIPGVRTVERSLSSHAFMLPRYFAFHDDVLVQTASKNYTVHDFADFFRDVGYEDAYEMFLDSKDAYDDSRLVRPGAFDMVCIGGRGHPTLEKAMTAGNLSPGATWEAVYGDGDKFLNIESMRLCRQFGASGKFVYEEFHDDHGGLILNEGPISFTIKIIHEYNNHF